MVVNSSTMFSSNRFIGYFTYGSVTTEKNKHNVFPIRQPYFFHSCIGNIYNLKDVLAVSKLGSGDLEKYNNASSPIFCYVRIIVMIVCLLFSLFKVASKYGAIKKCIFKSLSHILQVPKIICCSVDFKCKNNIQNGFEFSNSQ